MLDPNVVGCHDVQHRATDTEGSVTLSLARDERLVTFYSEVPAPQALTSPQVACAERERCTGNGRRKIPLLLSI